MNFYISRPKKKRITIPITSNFKLKRVSVTHLQQRYKEANAFQHIKNSGASVTHFLAEIQRSYCLPAYQELKRGSVTHFLAEIQQSYCLPVYPTQKSEHDTFLAEIQQSYCLPTYQVAQARSSEQRCRKPCKITYLPNHRDANDLQSVDMIFIVVRPTQAHQSRFTCDTKSRSNLTC